MLERIRHSIGAMVGRFRSRWTVAAVVTAAVFYLADLAFGEWIWGAAFPAFWALLVKWGNVPTRVTGLVLAAVIGFAFLWAAIDPPRFFPKRVGRRRKLSDFDRAEIERVREMWHGEAEQACDSAARLLEDAISWIRQSGIPFAILVRDRVTELRDASKKLTVALDPNTPETLAEVQDRIGAVVKSYRNVVAWLNYCHTYDVGEPHQLRSVALYGQWQREHGVLASGITALKRRAAFAALDSGGIEEDASRILLDGHRWREFSLTAPWVGRSQREPTS